LRAVQSQKRGGSRDGPHSELGEMPLGAPQSRPCHTEDEASRKRPHPETQEGEKEKGHSRKAVVVTARARGGGERAKTTRQIWGSRN